jgi:hypothetical protein
MYIQTYTVSVNPSRRAPAVERLGLTMPQAISILFEVEELERSKWGVVERVAAHKPQSG